MGCVSYGWTLTSFDAGREGLYDSEERLCRKRSPILAELFCRDRSSGMDAEFQKVMMSP